MHLPKNPKIVAIIQARMGSTRLPQKSTMLLAGKPLVDHVFERALKSTLINKVVVAIPGTSENEPIVRRAEHLGVAVFRGSENDLVRRYYDAALSFKADVVVRMCADNPLIHASEVDRVIKTFLDHHYDFASNVGPVMGNEYPDGLGAEVFTFDALRWIHENVHDLYCREHVHENFYRNKNRFNLGTVMCPKEFAYPDIVLDINTKEEYDFIAKLFNDLYRPGELINIMEIIPWYRQNAHLIPPTYKH
jgi:spore coat polysaccharide biosynthesis protein SpsF